MQNNKFVDDSKVLKRDIRINTNKKESIKLQKIASASKLVQELKKTCGEE